MAKTPPGDFKVTTPQNPLLSKQVITSKGILVPYTNLQLNPYPNTQLDLFCSDNFSFRCTAPNNDQQIARISVRDFNHQLEKIIGCKILQFIPTMKIKKMLGHKTLRCKTQQLLHKNNELGQNCVSGHNLLKHTLLNTCATCEHFESP